LQIATKITRMRIQYRARCRVWGIHPIALARRLDEYLFRMHATGHCFWRQFIQTISPPIAIGRARVPIFRNQIRNMRHLRRLRVAKCKIPAPLFKSTALQLIEHQSRSARFAGGTLSARRASMKRQRCVKTVLLIAGTSLLISGCVVRERVGYSGTAVVGESTVDTEVVVDSPPPAPLVETVTVAPDPTFIWIGGAWVWGGTNWRWEHGRWARPPHPGAVWVPHRYVDRSGRHVWSRGGWR
jgi:hypothetical protein